MPTCLTTDQVCEDLQVHRHTLMAWLAETPAGLQRPCVKVGRGYRWFEGQIEDWLRGLEEWRASRSAETRENGSSAGETQTAGSGRTAAKRGGARSGSGSKPKRPKTRADGSIPGGRGRRQAWLR